MAGDSDDRPRASDGAGERPGGPGRGNGRPRGTRPGPASRRAGGARGPKRPAGQKRPGALRLTPIGGDRFELSHPPCVRETELDYQEGMEIWKAGDPEGARDALRYALAACRDNVWVHVALGRIALEAFHDPTLARGHFAYAVELGQRAIPPQFRGRLPVDRPNNRPFYEAIDGLIRALDAMGNQADSEELRGLKERLAGSRTGGGEGVAGRRDPLV